MYGVNLFFPIEANIVLNMRVINIELSWFHCFKHNKNNNKNTEKELPKEFRDKCISSSLNTFLGKLVIKVKGAEPSVRFIST